MLRERYTNGAQTTLAEALDASETGIDVTDASSWPTDGSFRVKVESEIMRVTAVSGNTLTVERGAEGTTAATHSSGLAINHIITKGALDAFRIGILADIGVAPMNVGDNAHDDRFDDDSFSGWTTVQGSPNIVSTTEQNHSLGTLIPASSASAQHYAYMKAKAPSAGQYVQAGFQMVQLGNQYPMLGVIIADGATYNAGKQVLLQWSPQEQQLIHRALNSYNSYPGGASTYGNIAHNQPHATLHLRLVWQGSDTYDGLVSMDGITWAGIFSATNKHTLGTPTHMGIAYTTWGSNRQNAFRCNYVRFNF